MAIIVLVIAGAIATSWAPDRAVSALAACWAATVQICRDRRNARCILTVIFDGFGHVPQEDPVRTVAEVEKFPATAEK